MKLVQVFRGEGYGRFGWNGDVQGWSPPRPRSAPCWESSLSMAVEMVKKNRTKHGRKSNTHASSTTIPIALAREGRDENRDVSARRLLQDAAPPSSAGGYRDGIYAAREAPSSVACCLTPPAIEAAHDAPLPRRSAHGSGRKV